MRIRTGKVRTAKAVAKPAPAAIFRVEEGAQPFRADEIGIGRKPRGASARKRPTNVSIDSEILDEAKKLNINLSQTLEDALRHRVEGARIEKWRRENRAFVEAYNAHIERVGTMSEALLDLDDPSV